MSSARPKPVRWLHATVDDVAQIVDYIARDDPGAAQRFADSVFAKVEMLRQLPYLGSVCSHYRKARQLIHGSYVIYYTVHRREVVVRAVVHGARLFRSSWLRRED